jgi:poly-gamma-glutamate synthesis protein (capsule biosynthesis protein)
MKVPAEHKEVIHLVATGDILMHNTVIASGRQEQGYNYDHLFAPVKDILSQADYASVCLESALAGPGEGYTGYPQFNSPDELATALKKAGFDLVVTASNHCLDRGYTGACRTIQVLENAGLDTTGTFTSLADREQILIKDIRGIKIAYLAYTYGTNGIPVPETAPYFIRSLDEATVVKDITELRPSVDVLILVLHWGVEYSPYPTEKQRALARTFFNEGADIILGSHPHVIQPAEMMNINGKEKYVIYSMGNSIGHQRGVERNSGVIVRLDVTKDFNREETKISKVEYIPTFSHPYTFNGKLMFRDVPIAATMAHIKAGRDPYLGSSSLPLLESILAQSNASLHGLD